MFSKYSQTLIVYLIFILVFVCILFIIFFNLLNNINEFESLYWNNIALLSPNTFNITNLFLDSFTILLNFLNLVSFQQFVSFKAFSAIGDVNN